MLKGVVKESKESRLEDGASWRFGEKGMSVYQHPSENKKQKKEVNFKRTPLIYFNLDQLLSNTLKPFNHKYNRKH